jgi:hypothetical protein
MEIETQLVRSDQLSLKIEALSSIAAEWRSPFGESLIKYWHCEEECSFEEAAH